MFVRHFGVFYDGLVFAGSKEEFPPWSQSCKEDEAIL